MPKTKHGHTWRGGKSPTYRSWQNMLARCNSPSNPAYSHYKANGISVCERWHIFEFFLEDMGVRPGEKREYTLERINNSVGYQPGNCQWATWRDQANNRSTNTFFSYKGQIFTMAQLARATGVSKEALRSRLVRGKGGPWTVESAVETPIGRWRTTR